MLFMILLSSALASTVAFGSFSDVTDDETRTDDTTDPSRDMQDVEDLLDSSGSAVGSENAQTAEVPIGRVSFGGQGDDELNGSVADDSLYGGGGNDEVSGGAGHDILYGGSGNDILLGEAGDDIMFGSSDVDRSYTDIGNDILEGGEGEDVLTLFEGNNVADGGSGDDFIYGCRGNDTLLGGDGDDYLHDTLGENMIDGGDGNDQINTHKGLFHNPNSETVSVIDMTVSEGEGVSRVSGGLGDDAISIGGGSVADGGEGQVTFILGTAIEWEDAPIIEDYKAYEDQIVLLIPRYDIDTAPDITVSDNAGDAIIFADGDIVAVLVGAAGTVTIDDIQITDAYNLAQN